MKKKLLLFTFLLLMFIPIKISAYSYEGRMINISDIDGIVSWPSNGSKFRVGNYPNSQYDIRQFFHFHAVKDGNKTYFTYCASIGKRAGVSQTDDYPLNYISDITTLTGSNGSPSFSASDTRIGLLRNLIVSGYDYDVTNTIPLSSMNTIYGGRKIDPLPYMAMQYLVWEVIEGGRTTFSQIAPDGYNGADSAFNLFVLPNPQLYAYYKQIVELTNANINPTNATAFNTETYTMKWDASRNRYYVRVNNLGKFKTCTSSDSGVTLRVDANTSSVEVLSSNPLRNVTINCSYRVGSASNDIYYFRFRTYGSCSTTETCQNLLYGSASKTYSKSFKVTAEKIDLKIKKVGIDGNNLSGASFKLTHNTTTSYNVTVNANGDAVSLNKGGSYKVSEVNAPAGYEKISDFNITIDPSTSKVTECSNSGTDSSNRMTCANGQVVVTYENKTIVLTVVDIAKNFKIKKIDSNNNEIKGATFKIKDSNNQVMKFKSYAGIFAYDSNGNITDIVINNSSSYSIALLPEGEYKLIETAVPNPYRLSPDESERTTRIKINSSRDLLVFDESQNKFVASPDASVTVKNYTTKVKVLKTGNSKSLPGVKFLLYASDKVTEIKSSLSNGVYNYIDDQNSAPSNLYITDNTGYITVNYLPVGTYYFKEIETVENFVLPEGEAAYTKVIIGMTKNGPTVNNSRSLDTIEISNTLKSFNFYKIDEEGNYLTTGKFKIQKYNNKTDKYEDLTLVEVENDGTYDENADIFKVDSSGKVNFGLTHGIATFIDMEPSTTYRIVEVEAPEGFIKQSSSDTATATIDEYGNASGMLILMNQKILKENGEAKAELIVNIQTGQPRIRYAIIISVVILIIGALVYIQRKK